MLRQRKTKPGQSQNKARTESKKARIVYKKSQDRVKTKPEQSKQSQNSQNKARIESKQSQNSQNKARKESEQRQD